MLDTWPPYVACHNFKLGTITGTYWNQACQETWRTCVFSVKVQSNNGSHFRLAKYSTFVNMFESSAQFSQKSCWRVKPYSSWYGTSPINCILSSQLLKYAAIPARWVVHAASFDFVARRAVTGPSPPKRCGLVMVHKIPSCLVMKRVWEGQVTILCEWLQFDYDLKWDWNMCCFSRLLVKNMVMLFSSLSTLNLCNKMQGANCTFVCMCVCKYVCMGRWCDAMESNVSINVCMCVYVGMPVGRRPGCDVWLWCAPSAQWDELFALLWSHQSGWGTGGILEGLWNQVIFSCSSWRNIYIFCYWPLLLVVATYHWKYANLYMAYVYFCMHAVLSNGLCIWDGVVILHKWSVLFEVIETDAQM